MDPTHTIVEMDAHGPISDKTSGQPLVVNLGCRLNSAEGGVMEALAKSAGLHDAIIVNTCAVTAEAEREAKRIIRRLHRQHPKARIIATGCAATMRPKDFAAMPQVWGVLDNSAKEDPKAFHAMATHMTPPHQSALASPSTPLRLQGAMCPETTSEKPSLHHASNDDMTSANAKKDSDSNASTNHDENTHLNRHLTDVSAKEDGGATEGDQSVKIGTLSTKTMTPHQDIAPNKDALYIAQGNSALETLPFVQAHGKPKMFVQVQNGCNHFCSFCTIVLARGRSRSVPPHTVLHHIHHLLEQGVQEIVLTGVDLTSYAWEQKTLGHLVQDILAAFPTLQRLRLSSLDSIEIDPLLFHLLTTESRLLPHVHLSLQSGNNEILKAMRRRHTREQGLAICQRLRAARPSMAMGADFIVGFPGETSAMFQDTLDFVQEAGLTHLHVFPFSPRPKTAAARLPNHVDPSLIKERAALLRNVGHDLLSSWLTKHVGQRLMVMVEKVEIAPQPHDVAPSHTPCVSATSSANAHDGPSSIQHTFEKCAADSAPPLSSPSRDSDAATPHTPFTHDEMRLRQAPMTEDMEGAGLAVEGREVKSVIRHTYEQSASSLTEPSQPALSTVGHLQEGGSAHLPLGQPAHQSGHIPGKSADRVSEACTTNTAPISCWVTGHSCNFSHVKIACTTPLTSFRPGDIVQTVITGRDGHMLLGDHII